MRAQHAHDRRFFHGISMLSTCQHAIYWSDKRKTGVMSSYFPVRFLRDNPAMLITSRNSKGKRGVAFIMLEVDVNLICARSAV